MDCLGNSAGHPIKEAYVTRKASQTYTLLSDARLHGFRLVGVVESQQELNQLRLA